LGRPSSGHCIFHELPETEEVIRPFIDGMVEACGKFNYIPNAVKNRELMDRWNG
jgi:hypothetical protein